MVNYYKIFKTIEEINFGFKFYLLICYLLNFKKTNTFNAYRTSGHSSVVERLVANEKVVGSSPIARSIVSFLWLFGLHLTPKVEIHIYDLLFHLIIFQKKENFNLIYF